VGYARLMEQAAPATGDPLSWWVEVLAFAALAALLLLWGRVRGTREALLRSLRQQAAAAERERAAVSHGREADIARTRAEERSAIARDMHDTLSHQLSVIALHAGALASRDDLPPERAREAARTVRDAAAAANVVLREVLTALRSTDPAQRLGHHGGVEPLPTSASLDALVELARAQGQQVDLAWCGLSARDLDGRSPATAVSLAQITGELLLNARKHAPGAPVDLVLAHEGENLVLRASNPLATTPSAAPGTGFGLVGVAERARLLGGGARHGTTGDGRFAVEVAVPWRV
jgi:signal transduction histidine kinase